ncbi:MAG: hypothetical protein IKP81_07950 [Paludibacteraceae bacterium]|nr:hypothetical protein [Paludibacteraceae bacterium]
MKSHLFATAITFSALFCTNATGQVIEYGQDNQLLLAQNRGSGSTRGSVSGSTPSDGRSTRSTDNSSTGSAPSYSGATGRGRLQESTQRGSDSRGTNSNTSTESSPSKEEATPYKRHDQVRNNHHHYDRRNHHRHGSRYPREEVVVVTETQSYVSNASYDSEELPIVMGEVYGGGSLSSLGDNDMHLGFTAGARAEFGRRRGGYYASIGARYSKQNFSVAYGNDYFPNDKSEVEATHLQIPTTLFGYRGCFETDVFCGAGVGLTYQRGLGGKTLSKYHDEYEFEFHKENKNTYGGGLMSKNDLHGRVELYLCYKHITATLEASFGIINHNHFPNEYINWECSRNLQANSYLLTLGYRIY